MKTGLMGGGFAGGMGGCVLGAVVGVSPIFGLVRRDGAFTVVLPTFVLVSRMELAQQYPGMIKPWIPGTDLGPGQIPQIYSNRLKKNSVTLS